MFFEQKKTKNGACVLASANEDLDQVYLWDLYNLRTVNRKRDDEPHLSDWKLSLPKGYRIDNMRWTEFDNSLYMTLEDENDNKSNKLCLYELTYITNEINTRNLNGRIKNTKNDKRKRETKKRCIFKPNVELSLKETMSYFCMDNTNINVLFGTGPKNRYVMDIRQPNHTNNFSSLPTKETVKDISLIDDQIMVEYNQKNYVVFGHREAKKIEIFDIRKVG